MPTAWPVLLNENKSASFEGASTKNPAKHEPENKSRPN
jgi:hypothetical protein